MIIASPPRTKPNSADANAISRRDRLDVFMIAPARMNSGIASSGKLVAPVNITMAAFSSASMPPECTIAAIATTPSAIAIGTLSRIRPTRPTNISATVTRSLSAPRDCAGACSWSTMPGAARLAQHLGQAQQLRDDEQRAADRDHRLREARRHLGRLTSVSPCRISST